MQILDLFGVFFIGAQAATISSHSQLAIGISREDAKKLVSSTPSIEAGRQLLPGEIIIPPFSTSFEITDDPGFHIADLMGQAPFPVGAGYSRVSDKSGYSRTGDQGVFVETANFGRTEINPNVLYQGGEWDPVYTNFPLFENQTVLQVKAAVKFAQVGPNSRAAIAGLLISDRYKNPIGIAQIGHFGGFVQFQDGTENGVWVSQPFTVDPAEWSELEINIDTQNQIVSFGINDQILAVGRHFSNNVFYVGLLTFAAKTTSPNVVQPRALFDDFKIEPRMHCEGDLNLDKKIDDTDLEIFSSSYDTLDCSDSKMILGCAADFNHDGQVDDEDFVVFSQAYDRGFCSEST